MTNQQEQPVELMRAGAQGFSIAVLGIKDENDNWRCALETNRIVFPVPDSEHVQKNESEQRYDKTAFKFSLAEAFIQLDAREWYLCRPHSVHQDIAGFVWERFQHGMEAYNQQFPAESPMDQFIRENRVKEWRDKCSLEDTLN